MADSVKDMTRKTQSRVKAQERVQNYRNGRRGSLQPVQQGPALDPARTDRRRGLLS